MQINGRYIDSYRPPYIVAEISANHNGSLETMLKTIKAAKECGADAVKIQTYTPDTMTIDCDTPDFILKSGPWKGMKLYDLYKKGQTPFEWHKEIFDYAEKIGITLFSSPFDTTAVDLLESLDCPAYKIASFEIQDKELIQRCAKTGRPMILSLGKAKLGDSFNALEWIKEINRSTQVMFLHCISEYPTKIESVNMSNISYLQRKVTSNIGLSDHSLSVVPAVLAIEQGVSLIEKHFTLKRQEDDLDGKFSLEPDNFKQFIIYCKDAYKVTKNYLEEENNKQKDRQCMRSLYIVKDIKSGETLTRENVRCIRPGYGMHPQHLETVTNGQFVAQFDMQAGTPLCINLPDSLDLK